MEITELSQVSTIIIAVCSFTGLILGLHMCRLGKRIRNVTLCKSCLEIRQFTPEESTRGSLEIAIVVDEN